jgi:hypothetical protein
MSATFNRLFGGLTLSLVLAAGCETTPVDESVLDRGLLNDNPYCVGDDGFALGEAPPILTMADIAYTLGALGQLQAAVTPLVTMGLPPEPLFTGTWTNWSHEPDIRMQLAKLGVMRGILDKANLWDMYLPNINPQLVGLPGLGASGTMPAVPAGCNENALTNRTIDGTCNDLAKPSMGARGVRLGRNIQPFTGVDPTTGLPIKNPAAQFDALNFMNPSPREVSRQLFTASSPSARAKVPFLNMFAAAWIQFQVHDWFDHGESEMTAPWIVPLMPDDPYIKKFKTLALVVPRTKTDATRTLTDKFLLPPTYQNDVTHWWDGSQVYGSDTATADRLRSHVGGKLKVDANGLLPKAADGFDDTGFRKNWWIGLAVMHNLFAQEHNSIADMLAANHPDWTDQQIYDKARMINSALIVKIHTVEWTPAILPNKALEMGMNANWYGLEKFINWTTPSNPTGAKLPPAVLQAAFGLTDAQFKDIKPIIYGVAGGDRDLKKNPATVSATFPGIDVPYALTEEFVSVYRMHPLLPDSWEIKSLATNTKIAEYAMKDVRNSGARKVMEQYGLKDIVFTMGEQHPGALVLNNYPQFIQELDIPFVGKMDMGTVDLLRDRERGIPRYNAFRKSLRMKPITTFEELTTDPATLAKLKKVYGNDVNKIDALVGTLAESSRPECYGFGETLFQVFTVMATRRIQGDRFLTTDYNANVYTQEGLNWVETNSMKTVLLRHFPELASTGLADVKNAFYPWD